MTTPCCLTVGYLHIYSTFYCRVFLYIFDVSLLSHTLKLCKWNSIATRGWESQWERDETLGHAHTPHHSHSALCLHIRLAIKRQHTHTRTHTQRACKWGVRQGQPNLGEKVQAQVKVKCSLPAAHTRTFTLTLHMCVCACVLIKYANKLVRVFGIFQIANKTHEKGFCNFPRLYTFFNTSRNGQSEWNGKTILISHIKLLWQWWWWWRWSPLAQGPHGVCFSRLAHNFTSFWTHWKLSWASNLCVSFYFHFPMYSLFFFLLCCLFIFYRALHVPQKLLLLRQSCCHMHHLQVGNAFHLPLYVCVWVLQVLPKVGNLFDI